MGGVQFMLCHTTFNPCRNVSFLALGFCRGAGKALPSKNLAGALHADRVGRRLSVDREVKAEIPTRLALAVPFVPTSDKEGK